jgi:hypothetical protein
MASTHRSFFGTYDSLSDPFMHCTQPLDQTCLCIFAPNNHRHGIEPPREDHLDLLLLWLGAIAELGDRQGSVVWNLEALVGPPARILFAPTSQRLADTMCIMIYLFLSMYEFASLEPRLDDGLKNY